MTIVGGTAEPRRQPDGPPEAVDRLVREPSAVEVVILVGLPGAGKSTFYRQCFFATHVRLSLDLLRTRHRERAFFALCLELRQRCVIDNTNVTLAERARYLEPARAAGVPVIGYSFLPDLAGSLRRNAERPANLRVPPIVIYAARKRLQAPVYREGFDRLFSVAIDEGGAGGFVVEERARGGESG